MCRNKKVWIILSLVLAMSCAACAPSSNQVSTSSGSVGREEYLNVDALNQQGGQLEAGQYKVYTLEKGTYTEAGLSQTVERAYINAPIVRLELAFGTAKFDAYKANYNGYVEKGDVLATVYAETDTLALEESKLKLQRLEERYLQAEQEYSDEIAEMEAKLEYYVDAYEKKILAIEIEQKKLDWERTKLQHEQNIADVKETIAELENNSDVIEIYAPASGTVFFSRGYMEGTTLTDGDYICHILPGDECYLSTDKQTELYSYGMQMEFKGLDGIVVGNVISADSKSLYGNLDSQEIVFALEPNDSISQADLNNVRSLNMQGNIKTVNNVVLVPRAAVTVENDEYFVTVLKEDGSLLKTEFLAGGSNAEYFWVLEGLEEGTQIIIK